MPAHLPQPEAKTRLALAIAGAAFGGWSLLSGLAMPGPLGFGTAAFGVWFGGIALLHLASCARRGSGRPLLPAAVLWALFAALLAGQAWLVLAFLSAAPQEPVGDAAATAATGWLAAAILVYAARKLIRATAPEETLSAAAVSLGLLGLAFPVSALASAALFLAPHDGGATAAAVGYLAAAAVAVLALDAVLKPLARLIQPPSRRSPPEAPGGSFLIELAGAGGSGRFLDRFEELTGTRLQEVAGMRFLARRLGPTLGGGLAALWLSTGLTVVPLGSEGIRQRLGAFEADGLGPGIHFSLPRPFGRIAVVETVAIREIAVGLENDLHGPVLWTERHFEAEEHFLVGDGDEILTINLPILYRVADPRAYLANTGDAEAALRSLAEKELLRAISGRSLFDLIGPLRAPVAEGVHAALQAEADRLRLGLEIVFVGLKDMHPPIEVSDAYQLVASAEEDRETFAQDAQAVAVGDLVGAEETAHRIRAQAERESAARLVRAEAEAGAFLARAEADAAGSELFRLRLWHEALAEALGDKPKIILPAGREAALTIDHRDGGAATTP